MVPPDLMHRLAPLKSELDYMADRFVIRRPFGQCGVGWALFGSMVLLLYGLRESVADVDVFVAPRIWEEMAASSKWALCLPNPADPAFLSRRVGGIKVHVFYRWTSSNPWVDAEEVLMGAQQFFVPGSGGWPCASLELIRKHQAGPWNHDPGSVDALKHAADLAAIDAYFGLSA